MVSVSHQLSLCAALLVLPTAFLLEYQSKILHHTPQLNHRLPTLLARHVGLDNAQQFSMTFGTCQWHSTIVLLVSLSRGSKSRTSKR
jgi:hypothetical protein